MLNIEQHLPPASPHLGCAMHPIDQIKAGQQAWARLQSHSTWDDWKMVGVAIAEGRTKAMAAAKTNEPKGRRYNTEFGAWLRVRGFDGLEATTRKRLLQCVENIDAIEAWLTKLESAKRLRLNHPATVLSAWKRATTTPKPKPEKSSDWDLFFKRFTLRDFLNRMPPEWRDELLRRRDNLDKSRPDPKVAAAIKAALSHVAAASDPNSTTTVAASNEHAALSDLRGALRVLGGLDHTLHDIEIRLVAAKSKRKRAA
jgi:hypothetical protein